MAVVSAIHVAISPRHPTSGYNHAIGLLRAVVVTLVVACHALIAYLPLAPAPAPSLLAQPRWWPVFPVVDTVRWNGIFLFLGLNDSFVMALLFFLSGLFVWGGLRRKGVRRFLLDRILRLGLPFMGASAILAPLAYYPAYLQSSGGTGDVAGFWEQWLAVGVWPAGPVWFLWMLMVFHLVAAFLFVAVPSWLEALARAIGRVSRQPLLCWSLLLTAAAAVYLPMTLRFPPAHWAGFGPFAFQTSRIFYYFVYFLLGVGIGVDGLERGLLARDGQLAQHWLPWGVGAMAALGVGAVAVLTSSAHPESRLFALGQSAAFVVVGATWCFALLANFLRFVRSPSGALCLTSNSYAIYLVHYAFVTWVQFVLLPAALPAPAKGIIVAGVAFVLSWATAIAVRRIPYVARLI